MTVDENKKLENLSADVVIIGGGGAGLAAAVAAAQKGAKVVLLEKRGFGGNAALAQGIFGAESIVQKRLWIDCRKDYCFQRSMEWTYWRINPRIIRAFIDKSSDTIQWLEEKGLKFDCPRSYPNDPLPTWHKIDGGGVRLTKVLANEGKKLGAQLFTQTPAKKILASKEGKITGVLAKKDGKDFTITTRAVIIATGGFGGNKRMLKKYFPDQYRDDLDLIGIGHSGDGIRMAFELGAAPGVMYMGAGGPVISFIDKSMMMKLGTPPDTFEVPLMSMISEPPVLWVNKLGKRYCDESLSFGPIPGNATIQQAGNTYTLFDSNIVQTLTEGGLWKGGSKFTEDRGKKLIGLEKAIQIQADKGRLTIAKSWDEIADWMGTDRSALKATIDEYNDACEHGYDPLFLKPKRWLVPMSSPPFYAIECHIGGHGTMGGIKINENMEVIDRQNKPIPGLYAAGVDTSGWITETYGPHEGTALGYSVNGGLIAGENAAEFVRGK